MPTDSETVLQIRVSPSLKRAIMRESFEREMTLRCFVLTAIKEQGVDIDDSELVDRRTVRKEGDH